MNLYICLRFKKISASFPWPSSEKTLHELKSCARTLFHGGSMKLTGYDNRYRLRHGDYRILYSVDGMRILVTVVTIGYRREIYRH